MVSKNGSMGLLKRQYDIRRLFAGVVLFFVAFFLGRYSQKWSPVGGGATAVGGGDVHSAVAPYYVQYEGVCQHRVNSGLAQFWVIDIIPTDVICTVFESAMKRTYGNGTTIDDRALPFKKPVPKIIHQSWKVKDLSPSFKTWSASWKQQNPDWEYLLWTDVDNKEFVGEKYPEYFHAYSALPIEILRADMVRGLYMHAYGGVYADMDTWCLRPMDSFLNDTGVYLAEMSKDLRFEHNIPNAWMASSAGHPFWLFFTDLIKEIIERKDPELYIQPERFTGPIILKQALDAWSSIINDTSVHVITAGKVFVWDWHQYEGETENQRFLKFCPGDSIHDSKVENACKKEYPDAAVLTFWSHSWGRRFI